MTLVFALAVWIGQTSDTFACTVRDDHAWMLFARPKQPRAKIIPALAAALNAQDNLTCYRDGTISAYVPTHRLRALFGTHVELSCMLRAGNASRANGYRGRIQRGYLPAALKDLALRWWIENDPKFDLTDDDPTVPCPRARKRGN
jgi:hypothetical protein